MKILFFILNTLVIFGFCGRASAQSNSSTYGGMRLGIAYKKTPVVEVDGEKFSMETINATLLSFYYKVGHTGHLLNIMTLGGSRYRAPNGSSFDKVPFVHKETDDVIYDDGDGTSIQFDYTFLYYFFRLKRLKFAAGAKAGFQSIGGVKDHYEIKKEYNFTSLFVAPVLSCEYYMTRSRALYLSGTIDLQRNAPVYGVEMGIMFNF